MKTSNLILPAMLLFSTVAAAQMSEGGTPPSFAGQQSCLWENVTGKVLSESTASFVVPIGFDVEELKREDVRSLRAEMPVRVGVTIPFRADLAKQGKWQDFSDEGISVCSMSISAPEAVAISLYYEKFSIPEGGSLYLYSKDKSHVLGAYTAGTNPAGGGFATEYVAGDCVILEYVAGIGTELPEIVVSDVGYGYNHMRVKQEAVESTQNVELGFRASDSNMVDVNCSPEGDNWQNQKKGVAKCVYRLANGQFYASGTLVNNTRQDGTLYWLTADHNFRGRYTAETFSDIIFYFGNERRRENWDTAREPESKTIVGAELLYGNHLQDGSDVALLKITGAYDDSYDLFWNGWDATDVPAQSGVCIHHPSLDVKKISTFTSPAFSASWVNKEAVGKKDAHWGVSFVRTPNGFSLTEKGSDGAPLFNEDGVVVGVLTGKNIGYTETDTRTYFGKLAACWDVEDPLTGKTLADYLSPDNQDVRFLAGRYSDSRPHADFAADKTVSYLSEKTAFTDYSFDAGSWDWEFPGASPSHSSERNPVVVYEESGLHDVKLTINKGKDNEATMLKTAYVSVSEKTDSTFAYVTVGASRLESQFPLGYESRQVFDVSLYTAAELGKGGNICNVAWQSAKDVLSPQTVYIYLTETDETTLEADTWSNEQAGATLVYQGSDTPWSIEDGWCVFTLQKPFRYSGGKSLKVLVRTVAKQEPLASNGCLYSETAGMHMQWTSSRSSLPTSVGEVNANRPNIRLGFSTQLPVEQPVADFKVQPYLTVFKADFEGEDFFSDNGWKIENAGTSDAGWRQWTYSIPFTEIDAASEFSAVCLRDASKEVDSRLVSPDISVPENSVLEFYAGYSGESIGLTFSLSEDDGATWTELWTPGRLTNSGLPTLWRKQVFDLSGYAGKQIRLAWHNTGRGSGAVAIDNVRVYCPSELQVVEINEGDLVEFADMSSGPVVSWQWTLPGGEPSVSSESSPRVKYLKAGTYDVSLTVTNGKGTDSMTKNGVIVVTQQKPEVSFGVLGGYIRKVNNGRFIPAGAALSFSDSSLNYPQSWLWTFSGADTETSESQNPDGIIYSEEGLYDVVLEVSNTAGGTDRMVVADFVHVNGTDSVWNMPDNDSGDKIYTHTGGYMTGTNMPMAGVAEAYSERFDRPLKPCELLSVAVAFHVESPGTGSIDVSICEDEFGLPSKELARTSLKISDIATDGYTTIEFDKPVGIDKAFHVVFDGFNTALQSVDYSLAIKSSYDRADGKGTAYMDYSKDNFNGWLPIQNEYGKALTLNVVPVMRYAAMEVETTEVIENSDGGNFFEIDVESNVYWEANTDKMWITLDNASATQSGSFSISCGANPGAERSGIVTVSGGGITRKVLVRQSGVAPSGLTATVADRNDVILSWNNPSPVKAPEYEEDVEGLKAFQTNPGGTIGWNYIDGDGDNTFIFSDYSFPSAGRPGAFVVFNPSETTPASDDLPGISPHSRNQYFACLNAASRQTDDWLISPKLSYLEDFKFSFWAKTYDDEFGAERIRVAYSTSGMNESDFINVVSEGNYEEVPTEWKQYTYIIPAEAEYVAINCVSNQAFMLMVDDLYIGTEPEEAAGNAAGQTSLRWDSGLNMDGFGYDEETTFEVAVLFESDDLYGYHGGLLMGMEFFPYLQPGQEGTASYTLKIRKDNSLVLSMPVEKVQYNQYNRVMFEEPIVIDAAQTLSVGYEVHDVGGKYPAGYDIGPAAIGKGNLISTDGGYHFRPLTEDLELDVNWNIAAIMTPAEKKEMQYNVWRGGVNIATTSSTGFTDENLANGIYDYYVTAVYGNSLESGKSEVCTIKIGDIGVESVEDSGLKVYPTYVSPNAKINIECGNGFSLSDLSVRIIDVNGQEHGVNSYGDLSELHAPDTPGMYLLEISANSGLRKIVKLTVKQN